MILLGEKLSRESSKQSNPYSAQTIEIRSNFKCFYFATLRVMQCNPTKRTKHFSSYGNGPPKVLYRINLF